MKKVAYILFAAAILLTHVMCAHVAYAYRDILCGADHLGYSAPPSVAFLYAIPYLVGVAVCAAVGFILLKRAKR